MTIDELTTLPEQLGFDPERLAVAHTLIETGLQEGWYSAATYWVMRHGKIALQGAIGTPHPEAKQPARASHKTIFDMASLTKPMTATLLLQSVEKGELHLLQTVGYFLPETIGKPVADLTLRQLATHTSGLPPWKPIYQTGLASPLEEVLNTELEAPAGSRYAYSDLGYILLGEILSHRTGMPLNLLAQERIFAPLGMTRTGYLPDPTLRDEIAATRHCPWRGEANILIGEVHDANAHSLKGVAGHAGLFSCGEDMAKFTLSFFYSDLADQHSLPPILFSGARRKAMERQSDPSIGSHSIGWFCVPNPYLPDGDLFSPLAFGHTGFTGTSILFDPTSDVCILLLTNRVYSEAEAVHTIRLRRLISNIVAGSIYN